MFGLLLGEWIAIDSVVWIDEFVWRKRSTALLALVAICTCGVAAWALATDIAVSKELLCLRIVKLLGCLLDKLAIVIEMAEEIRSQLVVSLARGTRINIESDAKSLERVFDDVVVAIYYLLGGDALFACADGNRYTVFVATAYEEDVFAF